MMSSNSSPFPPQPSHPTTTTTCTDWSLWSCVNVGMRGFSAVGLRSQQAWQCAMSGGSPALSLTTPCVGGLCITMFIFHHPHRHSVCSTTLYVCTSHRSVNANRPRMVCIIEVYDWVISNKQNVEGGFSWHGLAKKMVMVSFLWCRQAAQCFIYRGSMRHVNSNGQIKSSCKLCCTYLYFVPRNV